MVQGQPYQSQESLAARLQELHRQEVPASNFHSWPDRQASMDSFTSTNLSTQVNNPDLQVLVEITGTVTIQPGIESQIPTAVTGSMIFINSFTDCAFLATVGDLALEVGNTYTYSFRKLILSSEKVIELVPAVEDITFRYPNLFLDKQGIGQSSIGRVHTYGILDTGHLPQKDAVKVYLEMKKY